ncbi:MAG: sigma-70 family RNA polymerase sigma factor [Alphaproteobacteria bacterium]|nr:sigma-70 family RNA polymerase sigma factor [Alphaproteobacteria bacterium]
MALDDTSCRPSDLARHRLVDRAIRKHDRMLVQWLTKKFGDREAARDIAQSAYLRIWRYAEHNEIDNPQALIFKTAANLAANEFRARHRMRFIERMAPRADDDTEHISIEDLASDAPSPEQITVARQDLKTSIAAIKNLPDRIRHAFILSRFENKNYREIAGDMKVSESSVEKYIIAALKLLRDALEQTPPKSKTVNRQTGRRRQQKVTADE